MPSGHPENFTSAAGFVFAGIPPAARNAVSAFTDMYTVPVRRGTLTTGEWG